MTQECTDHVALDTGFVGVRPPLLPSKNNSSSIYRMARRKAWLLQPKKDIKPPTWHLALAVFVLIRLTGAIWSLIADCDETFNYWEALHHLLYAGESGSSKSLQTWEYSPGFAIRSWAYIVSHSAVAWTLKLLRAPKVSEASSRIHSNLPLLTLQRRPSARQPVIFYGVRCALALVSASAETKLVTAVARAVNPQTGWYLFLFLATNAGLWSASVALLPSTFTFYTTTIALSFSIDPPATLTFPLAPDLPLSSSGRTLRATAAFALGALLGWPFALVLAIPFVLEEMSVAGANTISWARCRSLVQARAIALFRAGLYSSLIAIPILLVDTLFYGKTVLVPVNIIIYNILSGKRGAGPELYGTEPSWFYLANLGLNAGPVVLILALSSAPLLLIAHFLTPARLVNTAEGRKDHASSSPSARLLLLLTRTVPWYLWLGLLSTQPHKEERFMFPAYSAMCLNAAIALDCASGVFAKILALLFGQDTPESRKNTSKASAFVVLMAIFASAVFSLLRVLATTCAYHAPFSAMLQLYSLAPELQNRFVLNGNVPVQSQELRVCYGKEWYRFPNSFFLPHQASAYFVKSEFDGILPKHFYEGQDRPSPADTFATAVDAVLANAVSSDLLRSTRAWQTGFNDLNQEEHDRYIDAKSRCHLIVDSDLAASNERPPPHEPRYVRDTQDWEHLVCIPFLDSEASKSGGRQSGILTKILRTAARLLWLPKPLRSRAGLEYRDYCVLANHNLLRSSEPAHTRQQ